MSTLTELCCDYQDLSGRCDTRVRTPHVSVSLPPGWWFAILPVPPRASAPVSPRATFAKQAFDQLMSTIREMLAKEEEGAPKVRLLEALERSKEIAGAFDVPPDLHAALAEARALAEVVRNDKTSERLSAFMANIENTLGQAYQQTEQHDLMCAANTRVQQAHFCPKHPQPGFVVHDDAGVPDVPSVMLS